MTLPTTTSINGCDDDSDMFGPPRSSPPIGYHHHRSRVPMISPKLRQREERKRILQLCAHKLERIKDSETNLRRSVCINNTYCRLTDELRREKQSRYLANLPRTESKPESARENIFNPYNACGNDSNNRQTIPNKTHNDINGNTQCQTLANSTSISNSNNNNTTTNNNNYNPAATTPNTPTTTTTLTIANQSQRNSYNNDVHAGHNHNNHHHHNNNNSHSQNNNNNNDNLNSTKLCNGTNNNNNSQQQQQSQQCQHHHHHQQQQHQQLPNHIPSRKRQLSSNNLHNDLEILDRELSAIDAPMPLIDPEITQGAEQLEKAISSRKRLRSEDESDRLVREALSQFYIPPQRLISAIEDCPLDVVSLGGVGNCGQMAMNLNGNMMSTMHTKRQKMSNDLELDFDMNQNQKDFEVIMDALRLGTPSPTPSMGSVDSCGQAAMMSESASVFHNLVVTSLET